MTRLLASVTSPKEAEAAIQGGADLIDLKDPSQGALGALPPPAIRTILNQVAGRRPVSATIGDLPADPDMTAAAIRATAAAGVDYVKVGVFTTAHLANCLPAMAALTPAHALIAVLFADRGGADMDLARFAAAGCAGVMLDTADKAGGGLLSHLDPARLAAFVVHARALGLLCGLAGSLRLADIPTLLPLDPDYLGFRGALCREDQRIAALDPWRLRRVRQALNPLSRTDDAHVSTRPRPHITADAVSR